MLDKGQRIQAIAITAFGGPDQLKLVDLPVPPVAQSKSSSASRQPASGCGM
ncbi:hypothetical protein KSC_107700 [Ktedonobacter sp. SOSP1-52]|uniref:hypothetical protein n=1 Tax=Ktedonobacter sp. SOSP1-52 TaxID=2778366 RepID=UPI001A20A178|nr:hypothetical protein [Ktedonobacter sp. SOSP1-52]GHO71878.1 hypothetical protein KSC_107700 [Ktedonobacter sp. SOSP1-52]